MASVATTPPVDGSWVDEQRLLERLELARTSPETIIASLEEFCRVVADGQAAVTSSPSPSRGSALGRTLVD